MQDVRIAVYSFQKGINNRNGVPHNEKSILLITQVELCVGGVSKALMTLVEKLHEEDNFDVDTFCAKLGYFDDAFLQKRKYNVFKMVFTR